MKYFLILISLFLMFSCVDNSVNSTDKKKEVVLSNDFNNHYVYPGNDGKNYFVFSINSPDTTYRILKLYKQGNYIFVAFDSTETYEVGDELSIKFEDLELPPIMFVPD